MTDENDHMPVLAKTVFSEILTKEKKLWSTSPKILHSFVSYSQRLYKSRVNLCKFNQTFPKNNPIYSS